MAAGRGLPEGWAQGGELGSMGGDTAGGGWWLLPHGSFLHPASAGQAGAGMEFLFSSESNAVIAFQAADANKDLINYVSLVSQSAPDTSTWLECG